MIEYVSPVTGEVLTQTADKLTGPQRDFFSYRNGIPRFVPIDNLRQCVWLSMESIC